MSPPLAIKEKEEGGWFLYRCPHCNAWDYGLQGAPSGTAPRPGTYSYTDCGKDFVIQ